MGEAMRVSEGVLVSLRGFVSVLGWSRAAQRRICAPR